ncbi:hypothetical protein M8C21_026601, partial [Ambrosia artemisiifolia]
EFKCRCSLSKSTSSLCVIGNTSKSKDPNINDTDKNIQDSGGPDSYSNADLFGIKDIRNFIPNDTFLARDSNGDIYSISLGIENHIFVIDNDHPKLESSFYRNSSYLNNGSKSKCPEHDSYINDIHIKSVLIVTFNNYISSSICGEGGTSSNVVVTGIVTTTYNVTKKYKHLIELSINLATWEPMDEDMVSLDPIEFHSSYQFLSKNDRTKVVQTGKGQLDGINVCVYFRWGTHARRKFELVQMTKIFTRGTARRNQGLYILTPPQNTEDSRASL